MKEIRCIWCDRLLSHPIDDGYQIEWHYLYNQDTLCTDCWVKKKTDVLVSAKNPGSVKNKNESQSMLSARLNSQKGITELFLADTRIGWVQKMDNGSYKARSYKSGKIYHGKKIVDACLAIEKELGMQSIC